MPYSSTFKDKIVYTNTSFQKVLTFYLFNCPVSGTSVRAKTFSDYGWEGSPKFSNLKSRLLKAASKELPFHYYPCDKSYLPTMITDVSPIDPPEEYCVFLKHEERTVLPSLFSAIRNAFAHGSFSIQTKKKTRVYYFENYDGYMKAKIALREETLLAWMSIVEAGP